MGGAITATALDPASESMDYADMYATPSHSVVGSGSDDTIDATYTGDKTGDTVDNTGGDNSDVTYARSGDDTIDAGEGNDTVYGEAGDDTFIVKDGFKTILMQAPAVKRTKTKTWSICPNTMPI